MLRAICRVITLIFVASPFVLVTVYGGVGDLMGLLGGIIAGIVLLCAIKISGWV